ncbi:MAG: hypothetical protein V1808_02940 [Candidatus Daviesbacteria bacterium]
MKFSKLLEELNALNLPKDQYAITSSGPLAVREIREAADLDLIITDDLMKKLARKYPITPGPPCDKIIIGNIEILGNFSLYNDSSLVSTQEQINTADIISGHPFVNLEIVKKFKEKSGREKDLKDIELIDQYLAQH